MENKLSKEGCTHLQAKYLPTAKNKPVENFYEKSGYDVTKKHPDGTKFYEIDLANRPGRVYYVSVENG